MSIPDYDPLTGDPYPLQRTLGYVITGWEADYARVELALQEMHQNLQGFPHGGVYAVMIDTAAAFAGTWRPSTETPVRAMTLSMTVNFVGLPQGQKLIAEGRKRGGGKSVFFADVTLTDDVGTLVATGTATMRYRQNIGMPTRPAEAGDKKTGQ